MEKFIDREGIEWVLHDGELPPLNGDDPVVAYERSGDDSEGTQIPFREFSNLFEHGGSFPSWDIVIYRVVG